MSDFTPASPISGDDGYDGTVSFDPIFAEALRRKDKLDPNLVIQCGPMMRIVVPQDENLIERLAAELDEIEAMHDVNNHEILEALYPDELLARYKMLDGQPIPGATPDEQRRYICEVMMAQAAEKIRNILLYHPDP